MQFLKKLRWSLVLLFSLVIATGVVIAFNPSWIKIENIQVVLIEDSKQDLIFQRVKATLQIQTKNFENKYFWQVPLETVYGLVAKDKRVKSVSIYREFPSTLKIVVEPHTPVLGYLSTDGRVYPVATDATLLPPISINEVEDLPFLRGDDLKDEPTLREQALELINAIPTEGAFRKASVSEIVHTKKDGFKIYVSGVATEVQMGDSDFGPKVSRVNKVMSYLDSRNIKGRVIDARFAKKVVVRVRKAP